MTNNRKSMPGHLADHLASGRHIPGIFTIDANQSIGQTVEAHIPHLQLSHPKETDIFST
ncbi:hypothetical protein [Nostoc sp.]|uniref:hypothetical protein n=1 Tax=Nostoc sp. TaxID=1180 RepID=UPI002FF4135F